MGDLRVGTMRVSGRCVAVVAAAVVIALAGWAATARAGDATPPSTDELIRRLTPVAEPQKPAFRGIQINGKPQSGGPDETQKPSVDLAVNFAFGSAQLTADGELMLDELITRRIALEDINDGFAALKRGEAIRSVITF